MSTDPAQEYDGIPDQPGPDHRADASAGPFAWLTADRRRHMYYVMLAAVPLLVGYGITTETDATAWLGLAAAVLGISTAAGHTPTQK